MSQYIWAIYISPEILSIFNSLAGIYWVIFDGGLLDHVIDVGLFYVTVDYFMRYIINDDRLRSQWQLLSALPI